ncbi:hypothetical protein BHM03_00020511 [Ensete ventricosum]|nr:hypothetical protein BHM03_00020511 [Ensete ventricosum]
MEAASATMKTSLAEEEEGSNGVRRVVAGDSSEDYGRAGHQQHGLWQRVAVRDRGRIATTDGERQLVRLDEALSTIIEDEAMMDGLQPLIERRRSRLWLTEEEEAGEKAEEATVVGEEATTREGQRRCCARLATSLQRRQG